MAIYLGHSQVQLFINNQKLEFVVETIHKDVLKDSNNIILKDKNNSILVEK